MLKYVAADRDLACTDSFCTAVKQLLQESECLQALVYKPVDAGTRLEHHMYNGPFGSSLDVMAGEGLRARGPRLLSSEQRPGWKQCALTVTECQVDGIC